MPRRIVQVAVAHGGQYTEPMILVLCEDGTLWELHDGEWKQFDPIPPATAEGFPL